MALTREQQIQAIEKDWAENPRWKGIKRGYSAEDVVNLRGSLQPVHTLAQRGADKLWELIHGSAKKGYVNCLGALTGGQAVQQAKAGIEAIYLSGWQVAADNNLSSTMYPDQSLYPANSVPSVVESASITRLPVPTRSSGPTRWARRMPASSTTSLPIVADAEAGFGGVLNAFELMKGMIEAGAAGVHFEDQLASVKKCGHMGGKVLVPTQEAVQKLVAARLAADVCGTTTLVIARTDANAADLLTTDADPYDAGFLTGERTAEKASTRCRRVLSRPSPVAWPMPPTQTWCGVKPPSRIWTRRASLPKPSRRSTRTPYWPTTAPPASTGRKIWTMPPSPASSRSCPTWVTSTSSSPSRVSTTCGSTCTNWPTSTPVARG